MPIDYRGNPNKGQGETPPEKKIEKVVSGEVIRKKKPTVRKLKELFFAVDIYTATKYVAADVILPQLRNLLLDMISKGSERMIYGENTAGRRRMPEYRSYVQYNTPLQSHPALTRAYSATNLPDQPRHIAPTPRPTDVDNTQLVLADRREAELVVERLMDIIDKYDTASIGDLNDLVGLPTSHIDQKWGWRRLNQVEVRQVSNGYLIDLPAAEPI